MERLRRLMRRLNSWQQQAPWAAATYGVVKKFGDDNANLLVVGLAWYGFTAIFPLLLVVVTVFGFVGVGSLGTGIIHTLHEFPVVGANFNPENSSAIHGSVLGMVIGLVGLLYGAQGVTQTAQQAMSTIWNIPRVERTGFVPRLGRSLVGLFTIGGAFLVNAAISTFATGGTSSYLVRVPVIAGLLVVNTLLYLITFDVLTAKVIKPRRRLLPGAIAGATAFTLLITVGTGLVTHQLRHTSATYGAFGSVIGIVAFLLLLAKLSLYAAELNPVLARRLYPRALPLVDEPTEADRRVLADLARAEQRREDQVIGVGFDPNAAIEAAADATRQAGERQESGRGEGAARESGVAG